MSMLGSHLEAATLTCGVVYTWPFYRNTDISLGPETAALPRHTIKYWTMYA